MAAWLVDINVVPFAFVYLHPTGIYRLAYSRNIIYSLIGGRDKSDPDLPHSLFNHSFCTDNGFRLETMFLIVPQKYHVAATANFNGNS